MKHGYSDAIPALDKRLSRIEGQVRGVRRLVNEDTYCMDVMTQINAVQAALDRVAIELLRGHTEHCMTVATADERSAKATEIVDAVSRMIRR